MLLKFAMEMDTGYLKKLTELEIPKWLWAFVAIGCMSTARL